MNKTKKSKKSEVDPSLTLLDIVRGYSVFVVNKKTYYFKHFSLIEMLELDEFEKSELQNAKESGIQTEEELIESSIKIGSWSIKKEEEIKSLKWTINHSTSALNKISDLNQRQAFSNQIDSQRADLTAIQEERSKITAFSAEHLSGRKRFFQMIRLSLFYDESFKKPIKEKDRDVISPLVFSKYGELSEKANLLQACFSTYFFDVFVTQSKNPLHLFGADFASLTVFQKSLLSYSKALLNKVENVKIPKEIYGDPVKMFDYEEPKDGGGGEKVSHGMDDLKRKMQARGGELKPEDLLT
tara:strand:- start:1845 stop:2738 length:894 start_codon:yes stop_codon:yes gene_type:complete